MVHKPSAIPARRRGDELERALFDVVLAELKAVGYDGLTMENVAARARCGKGSLYRRWPGKNELILAALRSQCSQMLAVQRCGTVRLDLFSALNSLAEVLTGDTSYPELAIMSGLFRDAQIRAIYAELILERSMVAFESIIFAGICSKEIDPAAVTALAPRTGTALIAQHVLHTQTIPSPAEIEHIIDAMIGRPASPTPSTVQPPSTPYTQLFFGS